MKPAISVCSRDVQKLREPKLKIDLKRLLVAARHDTEDHGVIKQDERIPESSLDDLTVHPPRLPGHMHTARATVKALIPDDADNLAVDDSRQRTKIGAPRQADTFLQPVVEHHDGLVC